MYDSAKRRAQEILEREDALKLPGPHTEEELLLLTLGQHLDPEDRGFIAHAFNNPLTLVGALLHELKDGEQPPAEAIEHAFSSYERLRRAVIALTAQCWSVTLGDENCPCADCKSRR